MKVYVCGSRDDAELARTAMNAVRERGDETHDWMHLWELIINGGLAEADALRANHRALDESDAGVLVEPAGLNGHAEAAYLAGRGRPVVVWQAGQRVTHSDQCDELLGRWGSDDLQPCLDWLRERVRRVETRHPKCVPGLRVVDGRGWLTAYLNRGGQGIPELQHPVAEVYATYALPRVFKGWHRHERKTDYFCVVWGHVRIYVWKGDERHVWRLSESEPGTVVIPPGWWHGYRNVEFPVEPMGGVACIVNVPDRPYHPAARDQEELSADDPAAPRLEAFEVEVEAEAEADR